MSLETDLRTRLLEDPTVSGLVDTRIYPINKVGEDLDLPCIVYQRISTTSPTILVGTTALEAARIQLQLWSHEYSESKTLANAVKAALDGNNNTTFANEMDRFDESVDVNYVVLDFMVWNN